MKGNIGLNFHDPIPGSLFRDLYMLHQQSTTLLLYINSSRIMAGAHLLPSSEQLLAAPMC